MIRLVRRRWRRRQQGGHAVVLGIWQPDPQIQSEGLRHLGAPEVADRRAADPPDHLPHQEPEGERVVAVPGARLPERGLGGQPRAHVVPVVEPARRKGLAQGRQPGLVVQQVAHEDPLLAVGGELWPVRRHGGIEVELPGGRQQVGAQGGGALGGGHGHAQRVLLPGPAALGVGGAAPQVDDRLAGDGDGHRRPHLAALGEVALELLGDVGEALVAVALRIHRHLQGS
jgi:hypothetical protein